MSKKISVIVTVYNTEDYLYKCIESIEQQTYKNIEIIIVNDASPGPVKEIVTDLQRSYENIILVNHEKNKGLFRARITGLENAKGDFFAFVDCDDCIAIDYYRVMMEKAIREDADIVAADILEVWENGSSYRFTNSTLSQKDYDLKGDQIIDQLLSFRGLDYSWWVTCNKIYARHIWEDTKKYLEKIEEHIIMCEDVAFSHAFFLSARHFVNTHHNYYYYYRGDSSSTLDTSISKQKYEKNINDIEYSFDIAKTLLCQNDKYVRYENEWVSWRNSVLYSWKNKIESDEKLKSYEKKALLSLISKNILPEPFDKDFDMDRNFCYHESYPHDGDRFNTIKIAIADEDTKVVSFDIFDTLLTRPFMYPSDLFRFMDIQINELIGATDFITFSNIRIDAERLSRQMKATSRPGWEEVSLDDIYETIALMCPALKDYLDKIKKIEIETEARFLKPRDSGLELLECARAVGKKVICTSDMYLVRDILESILEKNDIHVDGIYVSCDIGVTKSTGRLYKYVAKDLGCKPKDIVHIGDNLTSDVTNANDIGIKAFYLARTVDVFKNESPGIYSGYWYKYFAQRQGVYAMSESQGMWGFRSLQAILANKIFDNPFTVYVAGTDFNANPYSIGYIGLGLQMLGVSFFLAESVSDEKFDRIEFMARDGYLPRLAFDIVQKTFGLDIKTEDIYLSRKAIIPFMLQDEVDYYGLHNGFELWTMTPSDFIKMTSFINKDEAMSRVEHILKEHSISGSKTFDGIDAFCDFGKVYMNEFFSQEKSRKYIADMKNYLDEHFSGKVATFDAGYNLRCEGILNKTYGYDITAHYYHINNDRPYGRLLHTDAKLKTLYGQSPFITGIMREHLISELHPSCVGFKMGEAGGMEPVFEDDYTTNIQTIYVTKTMQDAAIQFVKDVVSIYGDELPSLPFRYQDACMPMEIFLNNPTWIDQSIFRGFYYEDDLGMGHHQSFVDFWNHEKGRWGSWVESTPVGTGVINYDAAPFLRRWALIYGNDWGEGKRRVILALEKHPIMLGIVKAVYKSMRRIYRKVKRA